MEDFETKTEDAESGQGNECRPDLGLRFAGSLRNLIRRLVVFISFGPGILGFLWLLGRILKR
jgi:hypothetical protein